MRRIPPQRQAARSDRPGLHPGFQPAFGRPALEQVVGSVAGGGGGISRPDIDTVGGGCDRVSGEAIGRGHAPSTEALRHRMRIPHQVGAHDQRTGNFPGPRLPDHDRRHSANTGLGEQAVARADHQIVLIRERGIAHAQPALSLRRAGQPIRAVGARCGIPQNQAVRCAWIRCRVEISGRE